MDWSTFSTILAQFIIAIAVAIVGAAFITATINAIRKKDKE